LSVEHWENYFRGGQLATCPTGPDGGYDLELADIWRAFLEPLDANAVVVDVATGNGAVLALAADLSRQLNRTWSLHGCDLARIDPVRDVRDGSERFSGVQFHPGVATESLPFADGSVDAVCGQYALEYSDRAVALREVARVLKTGGRAQFVLHHADSKLMLNARASLAECEQVLVEWNVFPRLRQVLSMGAEDAVQRQVALEDLQRLVRQLKEAVVPPDAPGGGLIVRATLDAVQQLLEMRSRWPASAVVPEVARAEREVKASKQRLLDLVARASDDAALQSTIASAQSAGLICVAQDRQFHAETNLVGWRLVFSRS
jgi:ubiquinone/menaquinone biosynthesis C-methylase UbiE